ncbi:MAG: hypothetical protein JKY56_08035, partial [Kofleriaceae bacterium]|nr:hypothetical protein [Kofleriaceae bacterium]
MRVIILNEDRFYASLLGSAAKKLGHNASVVCDIDSALAVVVEGNADALLIDLESQGARGIDLAFDLHRKGLHILVGFCTGSCETEELLTMAKNLGPILPKVWTHADLRTILKEFQHQLSSQVSAPGTSASETQPASSQPVSSQPVSSLS